MSNPYLLRRWGREGLPGVSLRPGLARSLAAAVGVGLILALCGCAILGPKKSLRFDPLQEEQEEADLRQLDRSQSLAPLLKPPTEPYLLGPGDEIVIYRLNAREDDPNASLKTFIMPDGMVYFDLAPPTQARGKTVAELSAALTESLRPFYRRPEVAVALHNAQSRRFSILGKVYSPNVYPLDQPTTVLAGIARAGGLELAGGTGTTEELADLTRGLFVRDGRLLPVDFEALLRGGDMRYNIYLRDQDFIFLPPKSTKEILVLGAVGTSRAVGWREGMGLIGAIAESGGTRPNAFVQRVLLVRGSFVKPRVAILDYDAIVKGKKRDVVIQPGDIIWVPRSPWERLERYIDSVLNIAAETIAANEGLRLVEGEDAAGVGVGIQINPGSGGGSSSPAPPPIVVP